MTRQRTIRCASLEVVGSAVLHDDIPFLPPDVSLFSDRLERLVIDLRAEAALAHPAPDELIINFAYEILAAHRG